MPDDRYTHGHHDAVLRSHRSRTAANSAQYLVPHLSPGARLLDIGCGPGTLTADLAELVAPGEVVAVDREEAVVDECAEVLAERQADHATAEVGDVYDLAYEEASFDVSHAHQLLQHLSDPVAALAELRRVTRPGGIVAVRDSDYAAMTWYPANPALDRWLDVYRAVAHSNGAEPDAGRHLLAWAKQAGFGEVTASASVWCFADEASRTWWAEIWAERMTKSAVGAQAIEAGIASADDLDEIAAGFRSWAVAEAGWFTVLHGEIIARP